MNPDFLQPFIVDLITGQPLVYSFDGASEAVMSFTRSRLAWADAITGLTIIEGPDPSLVIRQAPDSWITPS